MFLFLHIKLNKESSETNYVLSLKWLSFNVNWHASSLLNVSLFFFFLLQDQLIP